MKLNYYLNLVANVNNQGIRDVLDIIPVAIPESLETLDLVGHKNGDGAHVSMSHHP